MEEETIRFISILPELFSEDLDRKTLWERIGNGVLSSLAKSGNDIDQFINNNLEFIKADPGRVAANNNIGMFIAMVGTRPEEWRIQFLRTIEKKHFLIIVKARQRWNENKGGK